MSSANINFALAFLESQPEVAAEVLELHSVDDVANFLANVPYKYVAPLLEKMLPRYAAKLCFKLDASISAGFMSQMKISLATSILRHAKPDVRQKILGLLPDKTAVACRLLMHYAEDTVGAWMETQIVMLPANCSVAEAKTRLASESLPAEMDRIYIVNRDKGLLGEISVHQLFSKGDEVSVSSFMKSQSFVLHGRSTLLFVKKHEGWDSQDALPVLDRNNHIIGTLRHNDLRKGLNQLSKTVKSSQGGEAVSSILNAYGNSLLALINTVGEIADMKKMGGKQHD